MKIQPIAALACLGLVAFPLSGLAAEGKGAERAAIERTLRIGTGLLWGGVAMAGVGGLTLLGGLIPTQRNLRLAEERRPLCMSPAPECAEHDADIERWTTARNSVAIAGSISPLAASRWLPSEYGNAARHAASSTRWTTAPSASGPSVQAWDPLARGFLLSHGSRRDG